MGFFTKIDYNRQLRQASNTTATFSGSTRFYEDFYVKSPIFVPPAACNNCLACSTGDTFTIGAFSATSASCNVTITNFTNVTGHTPVLSIGKKPSNPITGTSGNIYLTASTLQIKRTGLVAEGFHGSGNDLLIDTYGNVTLGSSSSLRYKKDLEKLPSNRYLPLLDLPAYKFTYKDSGLPGYGMIAEELHQLGLHELVGYNKDDEPDNIHYKLLSVALLQLIKELHNKSEKGETLEDNTTKVIDYNYTTNGEYLIIATNPCDVLLNTKKDKKVKIKSLAGVNIIPDRGFIDNKWKSISLEGDSCVELVFVDTLNYWVIVASDGVKDS